MKSHTHIRTFVFRATLLGACIGSAITFAPHAIAEDDVAATVTVDQGAPLHVTLLPAVSVLASRAHPENVTLRIADAVPLAATLLPTVHITAVRGEELASASHEIDERTASDADNQVADPALRLLSCIGEDAQYDWTASTSHESLMSK